MERLIYHIILPIPNLNEFQLKFILCRQDSTSVLQKILEVSIVQGNRYKFVIPDNLPQGFYSVMGVVDDYKIIFLKDCFIGIDMNELETIYQIPLKEGRLIPTKGAKYGREEFGTKEIYP
eukprot:CAMPEP_0170560612 /NCGR_PEP_ID=MMETSP0211-20121228/49952_1 /TAXON_ID=311385 /ORGANISM="Pseudokeronopsis sp., Strain OXSARD2" /LENGTH=119 /DNA_ID=CAMNT_0010875037 /DNA_START=596 /DNA_END=955 /DNA_ORIENTATION=-